MASNKILLINPSNASTEILGPPLGLAYLASYAREILPQYEYKIIDFGVDKAPLEEQIEIIKKENPRVIGLTAMTANISAAYSLAKLIKQNFPRVFIVLGGAHASGVKKAESPFIDTVVLGEGEQAFVDLIKIYSSKKKKIPKIYSTSLLREIKHLPAWDLIDFSKYPWFQPSRNKEQAVVYWSRGCPFNCVFCANAVWRFKTPRVRIRSPENIIQELKLLQDKYKIKEIYVFDDELNTNTDWLHKVCEAIIANNIKIAWKCQMRASKGMVSVELINLMKRAGCWHIAWGLESGDNEVLKNIKKYVTVEEIWRSLRIAKSAHITSQGLFMLGNIWQGNNGKPWGETYQDCEKTINFAKQLRKEGLLDYVQFNIATPYPGSEMWDIVRKFNLLHEGYEGEWKKWDMDTHNLAYIHPTLKKSQLLKLHQKAWRSFSFSPKLILTHLSRISTWEDARNFIASAEVVIRIILTGHPRKKESKA